MDMETVSLYAKYNAHANRGMDRIVSTLSAEEWDRGFGGWFGSVHAVCSHIFACDVLWLRRFMAIKDFSFSGDELLKRQYEPSDDPFRDMQDYFAKRLELDDVILSLSGELRPADLSSILAFVNVKGEEHRRKVGGLIAHFFNHQTHHRAMVSLYLEFLGRPNDFSSMYQLA